MSPTHDRLTLIQSFVRVMRQHIDVLRPEEVIEAAIAVEEQTACALAELVASGEASPRSRQVELSVREIQVLTLVSGGLPDKQIARRLGISTFTVNKHVGAILTKMRASSRTEAGVRAITEGFVVPRAG